MDQSNLSDIHMEIYREVYFSIACKDKAGALATVVAHLMESGVAMSGTWGFGIGQGRARIMAVPRDVERFKRRRAQRVIGDRFCKLERRRD